MAHDAHSDKHQAHLLLIDRLKMNGRDIARLCSKAEEADLSRRTPEGKWSLKELVCHLWRCQQVFAGRIETMLAAANPEVVPYDTDNDPEFAGLAALTANEALAGFQRERDALLEKLGGLSPEQWHRPGRHPEYPSYDVHFQVEYMLHHEGHHLYQMYQRRAAMGKIPH